MRQIGTKKDRIIWVIIAAVFAAMFISFMFVVNMVDVQTLPVYLTDGSEAGFASVGLATINENVRQQIGYNDTFYTFSKISAVFVIVLVAACALIGLIQWIKRKNMFKVDYEILMMGVMLLLLAFIYVAFTRIAINYRPYAENTYSFEASFPSSHTIMATASLGYMFVALNSYSRIFKRVRDRLLGENNLDEASKVEFRDSKLALIVMRVLIVILGIIAVLSRFLSGVHWFTDILAGIILSACLISTYRALLAFEPKK